MEKWRKLRGLGIISREWCAIICTPTLSKREWEGDLDHTTYFLFHNLRQQIVRPFGLINSIPAGANIEAQLDRVRWKLENRPW